MASSTPPHKAAAASIDSRLLSYTRSMSRIHRVTFEDDNPPPSSPASPAADETRGATASPSLAPSHSLPSLHSPHPAAYPAAHPAAYPPAPPADVSSIGGINGSGGYQSPHKSQDLAEAAAAAAAAADVEFVRSDGSSVDPDEEDSLLASVAGEPRRETGMLLRYDGKPRRVPRVSCWAWLAYYIPILAWLPHYRLGFLAWDAVAGLAVAAMLIPHSLSYAILAGLHPVYGLYAAFVPVLVYIIFGSSPYISLGPDALLALLVGSYVRQADVDPEEAAAALTLVVGCACLGLGLLRFGFIENVLSSSIMIGYRLGVAGVLICDQIDAMFGLKPQEHATNYASLRKVYYLFTHTHEISGISVACSMGSLTFLIIVYAVKQVAINRWRPDAPLSLATKLFPEFLVVLVVMLLISRGFNLEARGVDVVGYTTSGLPAPRVPRWSAIGPAIESGSAIAIIGYVYSIAVAKNYPARAIKSLPPMSGNRELVGLGLANVMGGVFGAFPVFGESSRTLLQFSSGAKTQLAGLVVAALSAVTLLWLTPTLYHLPKGVIAAFILRAAFLLFYRSNLGFLYSMYAYGEIALVVFTLIITIVFGVTAGLLVSIALSLLIVIRASSFPHFAILGELPLPDNETGPPGSATRTFVDVDQFPAAIPPQDVLIFKIEESHLNFSNIGQMLAILDRVERIGDNATHPGVREDIAPLLPKLRAIILVLSSVHHYDAAALKALSALVDEYRARDMALYFVGFADTAKILLITTRLIRKIGGASLFSTVGAALDHAQGKTNLSFSSYTTAAAQLAIYGTT